jgi:hypothetical protein
VGLRRVDTNFLFQKSVFSNFVSRVISRLKLYKNIFIYLYNMTKPKETIDEELSKKIYQRMYYLSLKKKKMIGITITKGKYLIEFS